MNEPFHIEPSAYCRDDGVEILRMNIGPIKKWVLRATDGLAYFFKPAGELHNLAPSGSYGEWVVTSAIAIHKHELDAYTLDLPFAMALLGVVKRPV